MYKVFIIIVEKRITRHVIIMRTLYTYTGYTYTHIYNI